LSAKQAKMIGQFEVKSVLGLSRQFGLTQPSPTVTFFGAKQPLGVLKQHIQEKFGLVVGPILKFSIIAVISP